MNAVSYQISNCFLSLFNIKGEVICEFELAELHLSQNNNTLLLSDEKNNNTYSCDEDFLISIGLTLNDFITIIVNARAACIASGTPTINFQPYSYTNVTVTGLYSIASGAKLVVIANVGSHQAIIDNCKIDKGTNITFTGTLIGSTYYNLPQIEVDGSASDLSVYAFY